MRFVVREHLITMGSGASTDKKPLTEVRLKSEVGVLFDDKAKRAFDAAITEGPDGTRTVPWPEIEAHAKQHDERALDPRKCLFHNLKGFKVAREQIAEIASKHIKGAVEEIPWVGMDLGDECRQCGPDGTPAKTLEDLYAIAKQARAMYEEVMTDACAPAPCRATRAVERPRPRRCQGARRVQGQNRAVRVVALRHRARFGVCETEAGIVSLYEALEANPDVEIVRVKNRFNPPLFSGYRDILMNVAVKVGSVSHLCELQIHLKAIKDSEPMHKSHLTYEFFPVVLLGNAEAVESLECCSWPYRSTRRTMWGSWWTACSGPRTRNCSTGSVVAHVDLGVRGRREGPGSHLSEEYARVWCGEQGGGQGAVVILETRTPTSATIRQAP